MPEIESNPMSSDGGGTLLYMAPELFGRGKPSKEADVWAFGMAIYVHSVCFYSDLIS